MCIGLVVTIDGFPLGYEVFAGNRNDVTTLEEIVEAMAEGQAPSEVRPALTGVETKYGKANRIWPKVRFRRGPAGPDGPGSSTAGS